MHECTDCFNTLYGSKAVWYSSLISTASSFTVPSGVLQPNTAYYWKVRVWDSKANPQNYTECNEYYFYTGTKTSPVLDAGGVFSSLWTGGGGQGTLLSFNWARCVNVAPWDIENFKVTWPDSTVLDLKDKLSYGFLIPEFNVTYLNPPIREMPDGTYTIEVSDKEGHKVTASSEYAYKPVPAFPEGSRVPDKNAYFDTNRPSFSWSRVTGDLGDGSYRYSVRIMSYNNAKDQLGRFRDGFRWYDSPYSADTSFTLPDTLNLPIGNTYLWHVRIYGPAVSTGTEWNNLEVSENTTFTINAVAYVNKSDATCSGNSPCYTSIQAAIDAATTASDIRIAQGTYTESLNLAELRTLTLQGGYDTTFTTQTPNKTFIKSPIVTLGSLTMQMLTIKP